jgi:hypothetical protein
MVNGDDKNDMEDMERQSENEEIMCWQPLKEQS